MVKKYKQKEANKTPKQQGFQVKDEVSINVYYPKITRRSTAKFIPDDNSDIFVEQEVKTA